MRPTILPSMRRLGNVCVVVRSGDIPGAASVSDARIGVGAAVTRSQSAPPTERSGRCTRMSSEVSSDIQKT